MAASVTAGLAATALPRNAAAEDTSPAAAVHPGETHEVKIGLVGCGGRGTGATLDALSGENGPLKVVAMGDVMPHRLQSSFDAISGKDQFATSIEIPDDRKHIGFDAYLKVMDALSPGDVVILATPPAFRWVHFSAAIARGLNVFMEKPVTVDAPTSLRMLELNEQAKAKNLKVAVGLMCRHCEARGELHDRIRQGEIGDLTLLRAYRMTGPTGSASAPPNDGSMSDLMHQIRHFHGFLWLSGGAVSDFLIHNIDECCWMKDAWPVEAIGSGGRHYRGESVDQNFDTYSIEYTFADGTKLMVDGRNMPGCHNQFASYAHGTKGSAVISTASHTPAKCRTYRDQSFDKSSLTWQFDRREPSPYRREWEDLIAAIRSDDPYNELERGVMASAVTSMGRFACHTGQKITLDQYLKNKQEFAPGIDQLTLQSESPLKKLPNGDYPVPMPGLVKRQEYLQ